MMRKYKVVVDGKEIIYGALIQRSRFSEKEWNAIHHKMVSVTYPDLYEVKSDDDDYINVLGSLIDMEERYETLLELLPQSSFSKAGTHPEWVVESVEENTIDKAITQCDVKGMVNRYGDDEPIEWLKEELVNYFELDKVDFL